MRAASLIAFLTAVRLCAAAPPDLHLLYRGAINLPPTATDQHSHPFKITGLSGIAQMPDQTFLAVMDNSNKLVRFQITFNPDCSIRHVNIPSGISLSERHDFEGIAPADNNSIYLSEEDTPAIHRFDLATGQKLDTLPLPEIYKHIMTNQGLESLTRSPDGSTLWTANERALIPDGNLKNIAEPFSSTTRVRLVRLTREKPEAQFVYRTSGVHAFAGQIGLCDLVALPDGRLLALERSAGQGLDGKKSIRTRIFLADITNATDVNTPEFDHGLDDNPLTPVKKTLLYDGFIFDDDGENLEGLCIASALSPNRFILVGCIDDTDGIGVSKSRLVAFELLFKSAATTAPK